MLESILIVDDIPENLLPQIKKENQVLNELTSTTDNQENQQTNKLCNKVHLMRFFL